MTDIINWLFLDLNAYFASVEQQVNPELRNKPVAVIPVNAETTCCIAASYEAKAFGIQTGTPVRDALRLCPALRLVEGRQDLYVAYHKKIVAAVECCIPVDRVLSVDEMICQLTRTQRDADQAVAVAQKIKKAIADDVGDYLRCSIGLASNRYLAKVAGDMHKPDGLTILLKKDLPDALYRLALRDLPGIGEQMEGRLKRNGIRTVRQLLQLSENAMHKLWGSIEGDRLFAWLRGLDTSPAVSHRHSIGHSHVLAPDERNPQRLYEIAKQLTAKASERLRGELFWTTAMTLVIQYPGDLLWEAKAKFVETQATPVLLKVLAELWQDLPSIRKPLSVSVTFHPLIPSNRRTPDLFEKGVSEKIASVVDDINHRFGRQSIHAASLESVGRKVPSRISFSRIPDLSEF